jgi:hypothetical protein
MKLGALKNLWQLTDFLQILKSTMLKNRAYLIYFDQYWYLMD